MTQAHMSTKRKPRLALMGEFSAGKSTLANFLLGRAASPVQVTATQLPPVWYSHGASEAVRVGMDGGIDALDISDWSDVRPDTTRMIRVAMQADMLEAFDLIDMPGTSDPNMAPDFWSELLPEMDLVIWCTPANQAWRQSEAALWEQVPDHLRRASLLLITRIDKMRSEQDRARVLHRVRHETDGSFRKVLTIALPMAIAHRNDPVELTKSGGASLAASLMEVIEKIGGYGSLHGLSALAPVTATPCAAQDTSPPEPNLSAQKVIPRRVKRKVVGPNSAQQSAPIREI